MKFLPLLILVGLLSCRQGKSYSQAKELTDSANVVFQNTLDPLKALALLDQATMLDSNYLPALTTKFNLEAVSNLPDKALQTGMRLIRIRPEVLEYYTQIGFIYEQKSDTISSKKYFMKAVACSNRKLEGMSKTNKDYDWLLLSKASNLVLAGEERLGNDILKDLYNRNHDEEFKEMIQMFMNKSKQQILQDMK
jgi:tetratricopeptide (TPR) repeat protein